MKTRIIKVGTRLKLSSGTVIVKSIRYNTIVLLIYYDGGTITKAVGVGDRTPILVTKIVFKGEPDYIQLVRTESGNEYHSKQAIINLFKEGEG